MISKHLLIIDPQNDFCDPKGALYVPGATTDIINVSNFITKDIDQIHITLDTHNQIDISHPIWWVDKNKRHPDPFTIITYDDIENEKWTTTIPQFFTRSKEYVKTLEQSGKYSLCIWPLHCLQGTWGHAIPDTLCMSLREWETNFRVVNFIHKGMNPWTEHYSAIKAEVIDPSDKSTLTNDGLIRILKHEADEIFICGEASSHCVASTIRDIIKEFNSAELCSKIRYMRNCCSPVPGFNNLEEQLLEDCEQSGIKIIEI